MNWYKFGIAYVLLVIIPVWFIKIIDVSIGYKLIFTVGGGMAVQWAINRGGAKRGFFTGRRTQTTYSQ